ncbi:MAG: Y-family DNA polymerase [Treponema sp.]|nr:Y-family DNA polymerase [Treponema sp.]
MILHADGNSFYASCEQIYRPDLRNKPVVVLSNNDGIIIALNKEAKNLGLVRGDVYFKVEEKCRQANIAVFSSNYTLYADISRRIKSIYMEYAPEVEEYSIDECFLFFKDCNWSVSEYRELGFELKNRIKKEIGIPICVGAGPSKTLAKLYNKKAKLHNGVYIYDVREVDELLASTDCQTIWGIGAARAAKLRENKIENALQLKHMPLNLAKKLMTVQGVATVQELNGIACVDLLKREKHDILTSSRQFGKRVYDLETLEKAVVQYSQLAVEKLRIQNSETGAVSIYLSTCNYYENDPTQQYSNGIYIELDRQTSYTPDIVRASIKGLHQIFRPGYGYKTVMISLYKLLPACLQGYLWTDPMEDIKKVSFMKTVDFLTEKYGRDILSLAKGVSSAEWQMSRKFLSPCWTTRISDAPKIR